MDELEPPRSKIERATTIGKFALMLQGLFTSAVEQVAKHAPTIAAMGLVGFIGVGALVTFAEARSIDARLRDTQAQVQVQQQQVAAVPRTIDEEVSRLSEDIAGIDVTGIDDMIDDVSGRTTTAQRTGEEAQRTADDAIGSAIQANRQATQAADRARANTSAIGEAERSIDSNTTSIATNTTAIDSALKVAQAAQRSADTSQESADDAQSAADAADQSAIDAAAAAAEARALVDAIPAELAAISEQLQTINDDLADTKIELAADIDALLTAGPNHIDIGDTRIVWTSIDTPTGGLGGGVPQVTAGTLPVPFADSTWINVHGAQRTSAGAVRIVPTGVDTFTLSAMAANAGQPEVHIVAIGRKP